MLGISLLAWVGVGIFWFTVTQDFHPTRTLAVIVTTTLMVAYALAAYVNHLLLIPRFWASHQWRRYWCWLIITMVVLTAIALSVIRVSYSLMWGPDAAPYGAVKHFAIDLFGMAVHLVLAAVVVWGVRKLINSVSVRGRRSDLKPME